MIALGRYSAQQRLDLFLLGIMYVQLIVQLLSGYQANHDVVLRSNHNVAIFVLLWENPHKIPNQILDRTRDHQLREFSTAIFKEAGHETDSLLKLSENLQYTVGDCYLNSYEILT